jgi:hypothetical protein
MIGDGSGDFQTFDVAGELLGGEGAFDDQAEFPGQGAGVGGLGLCDSGAGFGSGVDDKVTRGGGDKVTALRRGAGEG